MMKTNAKWLLNLISFVLNAIWYLNMLLIVVALCTLTIVYLKSDYTDISATVKYRSPTATVIKALTNEVSGVTVTADQAIIKMHAKITPGIIIFSYLLLALYEGLITIIIYNLRKIFSSIRRSEPFEHDNVRRLKITALCIVLFIPVNILVDVLNYSLLSQQIQGFHTDFRIADTGNLIDIILGVVIYIMADIFSYGFELKKENEEFV